MPWHLLKSLFCLSEEILSFLWIVKTTGKLVLLVAQMVRINTSACNTGDLGSIPESGRSSGEGNGNPLQYSYLENPMDGGAWQATVHGGVTKSWTRLSNYHKLVSYLSFFFSYCESRDFSLKQLILILSKKAVNF